MKTFFRVEHGVDKYLKKYYLGMYQSSVSGNMYGEKHPMPYTDNGLTTQINLDDFLSFTTKETYLFAFPDVDRLKKWVYEEEWIFELDRLGYVLSVYECDDGYHGDTQSLFNFEKAQLKHRLNLLEV